MPQPDFETTWIIGLLEGEGCFRSSKTKRKSGVIYKFPHISIQMCDRDVIERVADYFKVKALGPYKNGPNKKWSERYVAQLTGERAKQWLIKHARFFGERRRAKIEEVIEESSL